MFRLHKIEIIGFKAENEHIIYEFSDSNTTVVFGQNGCGKTSFLQILYGVFSEDETILANNKVKSVRVWCQKEDEKIEFIVVKNERNLNEAVSALYDWRQLEKYGLHRIPILFLGVERSYSFSAVSASSSAIYDFLRRNVIGQKIITDMGTNAARGLSESLSAYISFNNKMRFNRQATAGNLFEREHLYLSGSDANIESVENLIIGRYRKAIRIANESIQKALMATLSQVMGAENSEEMGNPNLEFIQKHLEDNYELISEVLKLVQIEESDILSFLKESEIKDIIDKCKKNRNNSLLLKNIISNILPDKNVLLSVARLQKMFNERMSYNKKMEVFENEIIIRVSPENGYHDINNLSSGEKQFLTLLTCIFIDSTDRSLMLIDEPELSLNINWQSELINLLMENAPETQILLAAHSPAIVDEHVECLRELQRGEYNVRELNEV